MNTETPDLLTQHIAQQTVALIEAKERLNAFVQSVPPTIEKAEDLLEKYDARGQKLYTELLNANARLAAAGDEIQTAIKEIAEAGKHGADDLRGQMTTVCDNTIAAARTMLALQRSIDGENGLNAQTKTVADTLNSEIGHLVMAVNTLKNVQISKLSEHALAIASLKTGLVVAVAFCAGAMVSSNPWLSVIGIGVLVVGVAFGWCLSWAFAKIHQR